PRSARVHRMERRRREARAALDCPPHAWVQMDPVRLSAPLALAALLGCAGAPRHAPPPRSDVRFDELRGDVWSFERRVSGRAPAGCVTVEIKRGPFLLRAPVRDGRFSGVVPLSPGENVVGAFCADPPVPASAARVVYRVRL